MQLDQGQRSGQLVRFLRHHVGNNDVPCYGTNNCYTPSGDSYGVLSVSDNCLKVAYTATTGWDFTTGLGTPNITNL